MALSLKKNFGFALIGNLGYAASQYLILLTFVKLYTIEDVGVFIYAGAFTTPLMMALDMHLRNFYITDQENKYSFSTYLTFKTLTNVIGIVVLGVASFIFKPSFFNIILVVVCVKVFESQLDLIYGVYQKNNRLDYIAYSRIIRGLIAVVIVFLVSFFLNDIFYSLLAYLFIWFSLYFFYERKQVVKRGFIKKKELSLLVPKWGAMKPLLYLGFPMFISIFIDKYYASYPRIAVENFLGVEMLGVFGSLLYFKSVGGQFIGSLAQSAVPKLSTYFNEKKINNFNRLLIKMISIGFFIGLMLTLMAYLLGSELLVVLYTPEYAEYSKVLVCVLLGATVTFSYAYIATALTCIRKQWLRLPVSVLSFIALFILIKINGITSLMDAAILILYVECFTFLIYFLVYILFLKREVNSWRIKSN